MQLPELKSMDKSALLMYKLLAASAENNWYYDKVNYMEKYYEFVWLHCKQSVLHVQEYTMELPDHWIHWPLKTLNSVYGREYVV